MKKVLLVAALLLAFAVPAFAGWTGTTADRTVSWYTTTNSHLAWYSRAAIGPEGNLYLIWRQGPSSGPYEIYFGMSTDNGTTWSSENSDRMISANNGLSVNNTGERPLDIDADNSGNIFAVWPEDHVVGLDTVREIMFMKSTDQGTTWIHSDANFPISHVGAPFVDASNPSMATDHDNNIYVVWFQKNSVDTTEICFSKSTDSGDTWTSQTADRFISYSDGFHAANPDISVDLNNNIYVVWDERESSVLASGQILYGKSTDGGVTFNCETADLPITVGLFSTDDAYMTVGLNNNIYVTWAASRATASPYISEVFFSGSTDGGATWSGNSGPIPVDPGVADGLYAYTPSIAVTSDGNLAIVWHEEIDYPLGGVFASYSFDGGATWTGTTQAELISFNDAHPAYRADIFVSRGDTLHVFWNETVDNRGYYDIHYSKGDTLGTALPTTGTISGHVFETNGTTPILGVFVETFDSLDQRVEADTTDALGAYQVSLYPGTYREHFSKDGYSAADLSGIVVLPGQTTPVSVNLSTISGCIYLPGDINSNGYANGIDVVYGVTYLKGGAVPPDTCADCPAAGQRLYAAMDVNGNCATNGIDITFYVAYLKGIQPTLRWCPDCPPASRRN